MIAKIFETKYLGQMLVFSDKYDETHTSINFHAKTGEGDYHTMKFPLLYDQNADDAMRRITDKQVAEVEELMLTMREGTIPSDKHYSYVNHMVTDNS